MDYSTELIVRLCDAGADLLEVGIPFSDPIADGPAIQGAMQRALRSKFKIGDTFSLISSLRGRGIEQPIVVMSYYNPILRMGIEKFCSRLSESGGDGLLVVDLPPEESSALDEAAKSEDIDVIRLIAQSTGDDRLEYILSGASGFVYVVSVSGITGARDSLPDSAISLLRRVAAKTNLPVALGFGISRPKQVREAIEAGASGVIEGSRLIQIYAESLEDRSKSLDMVEEHAREMKSATVRNTE